MIYTFIAYAPKEHERDLAWTYNEFMRLLPNDDDWGCFIDHDAMFTTSDWYQQMEKCIEAHPEFSCLTVASNRVYAEWQIPMGVNKINHDMTYHRSVGANFQKDNGSNVVDVTVCDDIGKGPDHAPLSGVVILYKKSAWKQVPFRLLEPNRLTGIDNLLHMDLRDRNLKVGLMTGVYVYHWHRADGVNLADIPKKPVAAPVQGALKPTGRQIKVPFDNSQIEVDEVEEKPGMDVEAANTKIAQCKDDNFVVIGAPLPYNREIDVQTCLWIEYQKRKPNMVAFYECTRFAAFGRNNVIYNTLHHLPDVTHIFFIDKDVLPPIDAIERLMAHDKDIIVGATPIYRGEQVWSVMKYDPTDPADNVFNPVRYNELPDELFRAHHFGGTTCLVKRHVYEKMGFPWYQDVFAPGRLLLGQDLFFTAKAKLCGFELWCDPTVKCGHDRMVEMKTVFDQCCLENDNGKVKN